MIQDDLRALNKQELMRRMKERWPTAEWCEFKHIHASPSCRTHSPADRGFGKHRYCDSRPRTKLAKQGNAALRRTLQLIDAGGGAGRPLHHRTAGVDHIQEGSGHGQAHTQCGLALVAMLVLQVCVPIA